MQINKLKIAYKVQLIVYTSLQVAVSFNIPKTIFLKYQMKIFLKPITIIARYL